MKPNDNTEIEDNYDDMEEALERQEVSEKTVRIWRNRANYFLSSEQLSHKGKLLGHYKSTRFLKTYIDIYERAIIGKAETGGAKKVENISCGYAYLAKAIVENGVLYLLMSDERIYRIRHLKMVEMIGYMINGQKIKAMKEDNE